MSKDKKERSRKEGSKEKKSKKRTDEKSNPESAENTTSTDIEQRNEVTVKAGEAHIDPALQSLFASSVSYAFHK
jgi:hypothetical protein